MADIKDNRRLPYQIQPDLDEYGLDPFQFRIYCRVVRRAGRGECFESVSNMAAGCRMSVGKVKDCLKFLVDHRFITRHSRPGKTSFYRLNDTSLWIQPSHVATQVPGHVATQVEYDPGCEMATGGHETTQVPGHVVATKNTHKELPLKKEDPAPSPESSPSADEVNAHEVPRPKKAGYVHPAVLMEMNFANGGESPLPWVVKRIGPYQYEYDPEMVLATIEYLKTTPSYEKNPPTPKNAKSWISVCNNPNHEKYATRMELAYAVWESAQKLKQRNAEAAQKQAAQDAQGDAVLQHLYRRWGGTPA